MIHCVQNGFDVVVVRTLDTDVLISVISFRYLTDQYDISNVFSILVLVTKQNTLMLNAICLMLAELVYKALLFFCIHWMRYSLQSFQP